MDFAWSEEQTELRKTLVKFAKEELNEGLLERDKEGTFNREGWNKCAAMGVMGMPIPQEYGGSGLDILSTVGALEGLGYGCKDNGLVFSINAHMWTAEIPVLTFGTDEQKQRYLPKLLNGEM